MWTFLTERSPVFMLSAVFGMGVFLQGCHEQKNQEAINHDISTATHTVELWSGGVLIREWKEARYVSFSSDGTMFHDNTTDLYIRVRGTVVVTEIEEKTHDER